jgi:hypothetical protein
LPLFEQTLATAVPAYPVAQFQPITEKVLIARLVSVLLAPLYPVNDDEGAVHVERLQPLKEYFVLCVVHATAAAVPVYPAAHVQPVTAKVLIARLVSVLLAPLYSVDGDEGAVQVERLQTRLVVLLQAVVWYSPLTHAVHVWQT